MAKIVQANVQGLKNKVEEILIQDINNEHVQAVACQVEQLRMLIISVYVKPNTPKEMFRSWFRKARERMTKTNSLITILAGDFNAHHGAWGNPYEDAKGRILLEKCEVGDLLVLQNGEHTLVSNNGTKTAIDLIIIPINMAHRVQNSIGASSHKMIIITIDKTSVAKKIKISNRNKIHKQIQELEVTKVTNIDSVTKEINNIRKRNTKTSTYVLKSWWTENVEITLNEMRKNV